MYNILIADDSLFMRQWIRKMVEEHGHQVVAEAKNGKEAINLYQQYKPNIVLLDITMDEMDGITALKTIIKRDSNAKVIMCSSLGSQQIVMDCIHSGAKDFVVKPYFYKLSETIQKAINA
ncbi:response regulator [Aquisalibacillus elongatus]|uniref:Two-component system chemotaxis response regulator CheY n=1 Tax=Aquisalibacillus elongatus TaxID=485577 RepID=A0A3N5C7J4_9BACI|nr:response regulator [Aquisalibacillus elongatus]RPF55442.1 two-component system chemotaxis response regulator CheY [Aquisalibacillus elongatus]